IRSRAAGSVQVVSVLAIHKWFIQRVAIGSRTRGCIEVIIRSFRTSFAESESSNEQLSNCTRSERRVVCASEGSPSTSAVVRPDGSLLCYQPYGKEGLLIADIDLGIASGLFASRCKYVCDNAQ